MSRTEMAQKKTLFEKIWNAHLVAQPTGRSPILYIDLHLVHEVTSPQAFDGLRGAGRKVRQPARTVATVDHNIPTEPRGTLDGVVKDGWVRGQPGHRKL